MELKVGMYVKYIRGTINGYVPPRIGKITDCSDKDLIKIDNGQVILKADILKASYNIIDLIEVGDYVNGDLVLFSGATTWDNDGNVLDKQVHINHNGYDLWLREEYIKSILTKEQFENNCYKVEE